MTRRTAVYFIASPLQYLAARQVASQQEVGSRQVLVWYQPGVAPVVRPADWDAAAYMPWPRFHPLPGPFGRHRRLCRNVAEVGALVGRCDELVMHSAVYDTEAINYFLHALPRVAGARRLQARILPDGTGSLKRYPLTAAKRLLQHVRGLRRLLAPGLRYTPFAGDRIGSDAPFCDRIYVMAGLPHEYPAHKVIALQPLVAAAAEPGQPRRALVIGQPLLGGALIDGAGSRAIQARLRGWLAERGITEVHYKGHPKDPRREFSAPGDIEVLIEEPLETWLAGRRFAAVLGVHSSALLFARQLYGADCEVVAFGWEHVHFRSPAEREAIGRAFAAAGISFETAPPATP